MTAGRHRRSEPPWTADQVASIRQFQGCGFWHPFTCPTCGGDLDAREDGMFCPSDGYTQGWAHEVMTDWSWKELNWTQLLEDRTGNDGTANT